jgi:hypothetical protein
MPIEHEIYENFSFFMKAGKRSKKSGILSKFILGAGATVTYSFLNVPNYDIYLTHPDVYIPATGLQNYLSVGPSVEPGFEILNKSSNFSFQMTFPVEVTFPAAGFRQYYISVLSDKLNLIEQTQSQASVKVGVEAVFSFYRLFRK